MMGYLEPGDCEVEKYELIEENKISYYSHMYDLKTHKITEYHGESICNGPQCITRSFVFTDMYIDIQIVDTDYQNYAIVYSCQNLLDYVTFDYVWIMTRTKTVD